MANINSFLIERQFKAPLSKKIQAEYNKLLNIVAQIPLKYRRLKKIDGTGGNVSVADIIAYQIGWGTLLIGWYKAGIKGKKPSMPGEGFSIWDYSGLAQHFYAKYQHDASYKQIKEFHAVVGQILDIVEKEHQSGNLDKIGVWPWCTLPSNKQWPLSKWCTVNTTSPYKRAIILTRKFLKKLPTIENYK